MSENRPRLIVVDQIIEKTDLKHLRDWYHLDHYPNDSIVVIITRVSIASELLHDLGLLVTPTARVIPTFAFEVSGGSVPATEFLPSDWTCFPSISQRLIKLMSETQMPPADLRERLSMMLSTREWLQNSTVQLAFRWTARMFFTETWPTSMELAGNGDAATLFTISNHAIESIWLRVFDEMAEEEPGFSTGLEIILLAGDTHFDVALIARLNIGHIVHILQDRCILITEDDPIRGRILKCPSAMNLTAKTWLMQDR